MKAKDKRRTVHDKATKNAEDRFPIHELHEYGGMPRFSDRAIYDTLGSEAS